LVEHRDSNGGEPIAAMEFVPAGADDDRQWAPTCRLWRGLPSIPRVVAALPGEGAPLLLRYAAIDWLHQPIKIKRNEQAMARNSRPGASS
jgi:hypothetical protein